MICKECGAKIEGLTRLCPHCGNRALLDDELETWSFIADTAQIRRREMPAQVSLNAPVDMPEGREAQIEGLRRLKDYFTTHSSLYQVVDDLAYMEGGLHRPSFAFWVLSGGLAAALLYVPLSPFLPNFIWAYYFVLWGGVTSVGYLRAGRKYERYKAEHEIVRRHAENDLRAMYNRCEDCFLPLDWTPPPRIGRMIAALCAGKADSVQDYMMKGA